MKKQDKAQASKSPTKKPVTTKKAAKAPAKEAAPKPPAKADGPTPPTPQVPALEGTAPLGIKDAPTTETPPPAAPVPHTLKAIVSVLSEFGSLIFEASDADFFATGRYLAESLAAMCDAKGKPSVGKFVAGIKAQTVNGKPAFIDTMEWPEATDTIYQIDFTGKEPMVMYCQSQYGIPTDEWSEEMMPWGSFKALMLVPDIKERYVARLALAQAHADELAKVAAAKAAEEKAAADAKAKAKADKEAKAKAAKEAADAKPQEPTTPKQEPAKTAKTPAKQAKAEKVVKPGSKKAVGDALAMLAKLGGGKPARQ